MVFSRKYIRGVEVHVDYLVIVDPWQTCAALSLLSLPRIDRFESLQRVQGRVSFGMFPFNRFIYDKLTPRPSSAIIQDIMALREAGLASMAYFYFDFRDTDKQNLHNALPSLRSEEHTSELQSLV